jgi:hypothetical protein
MISYGKKKTKSMLPSINIKNDTQIQDEMVKKKLFRSHLALFFFSAQNL